MFHIDKDCESIVKQFTKEYNHLTIKDIYKDFEDRLDFFSYFTDNIEDNECILEFEADEYINMTLKLGDQDHFINDFNGILIDICFNYKIYKNSNKNIFDYITLLSEEYDIQYNNGKELKRHFENCEKSYNFLNKILKEEYGFNEKEIEIFIDSVDYFEDSSDEENTDSDDE